MVYADKTPVVDYASHSTYSCAATYPEKTAHYERIVENCMKAGVTRNKSVLDVGPGTGGLMQAFLAAGFQVVHGLSISQTEVEECQNKGLMVLCGDISSTQHRTDPYDLVTLSHVLEHIPEPLPFLRAIKRWIKPNGCLYVEVPNARHYADYFTSICQGFNNEHINHFDDTHLHEALLLTGFASNGDSYIANDGHPYPCVWAIADPWRRDDRLRDAVMRYTEILNSQMDQTQNRLWRNGLDSYRGPVAIWGTGQTAQLLLSKILGSYPIAAATDTNPAYHGQYIKNCMIVPPEEFRPVRTTPIVVCSQLNQKAIAERIRELGLSNRIITLGDE